MKNWYPSSSKIALIANADLPDTPLIRSLIGTFTTIVAVDGGLRHCKHLNITPSLIIGDFDSAPDSLRQNYRDCIQINTPDPNKTDLEKALEFLSQFEPTLITVFAALGSRIDHTLTNVCLLTRYPGKVIFETNEEQIWALEKTTTLSCRTNQILSLIPFNGEVKGITTEGLKWNLMNGTLNKHFVGISNLCLAHKVNITYLSGDLVLCLQR